MVEIAPVSSVKNMLYHIQFNSSGPVVQMPCPSGHTVTGRFYKIVCLPEWIVSATDNMLALNALTHQKLFSLKFKPKLWLKKPTHG